jgi:hypothetical protein
LGRLDQAEAFFDKYANQITTKRIRTPTKIAGEYLPDKKVLKLIDSFNC